MVGLTGNCWVLCQPAVSKGNDDKKSLPARKDLRHNLSRMQQNVASGSDCTAVGATTVAATRRVSPMPVPDR